MLSYSEINHWNCISGAETASHPKHFLTYKGIEKMLSHYLMEA